MSFWRSRIALASISSTAPRPEATIPLVPESLRSTGRVSAAVLASRVLGLGRADVSLTMLGGAKTLRASTR